MHSIEAATEAIQKHNNSEIQDLDGKGKGIFLKVLAQHRGGQGWLDTAVRVVPFRGNGFV